MQPLSPHAKAMPARPRRARAAFLALITLTAAGAVNDASAAPCPWIVQPHREPIGAGPLDEKAKQAAFDILFDGLAHEVGAFYGFSVTSTDLAWEIADENALPDLSAGARRLQPTKTPLGTLAYRLAPDTVEPHTIYLVTARSPVDELEEIGARIEPDRPLAISQLAMRTRGGSDQSGPLPHRSLPGFLIADADGAQGPDLQICAYQVAVR